MPKRRPSLKELQDACFHFNREHPPGTDLLVANYTVADPWKRTKVREGGAFVLGGHTAVVLTEDFGTIAIRHTRPIVGA